MLKHLSHKKSFFVLLLMAVVMLFVLFKNDLWHRNRISLDAPSYYTYLPATFIHHDLKLKFIDADPAFFKDKIWYYTIENKQRLIKHPLGLSLSMTPFFLAGHMAAKLSGAEQTGYSMPYQNAISIGVLLYLFFGLFLLRKLLLLYYSDNVTAWVLLITLMGTNLLWYSSVEAFMPHAISFSFLCMALYQFHAWLLGGKRFDLLMFAFLFALIVLIRPLAITILVYFLLVGCLRKGGWRSFFQFLKNDLKGFVLALLLFCLLLSLQLCYWKYATGKWIYDVYIDEHFIFSSPQMLPFLFSFRKGLFVYTPLMLIAVLGLINMFKRDKALFYPTLLIMILSVYILSSWWAWSYGICWGMRPMIDYYSILSLPMGAGLVWMIERGTLRKVISTVFILLLIALNLFQSWQYKNGLIHFDDMSKEAYFKGFFQTSTGPEWYDLLKPYDWDRRMKGLDQIVYDRSLLNGLNEQQPIYFRASNLQFVSVNDRAQNMVAAYAKDVNEKELFFLQHLRNDTVCIRSSNGLLLSLVPELDNSLVARSLTPGVGEKFVLTSLDDDDNRIALKASNGRYLTSGGGWPFILKATSKEIGKEETFRFFLNNTAK